MPDHPRGGGGPASGCEARDATDGVDGYPHLHQTAVRGLGQPPRDLRYDGEGHGGLGPSAPL